MGWTYNTKDPNAPTDGPMITGVAIVLTALSFVTVCLRTYVRAILIKALGVDDWVVVVTWVAAAGFAIVTIVQTKWGLGLHHITDLPTEDIYNFGLLQYIGAPFYIASILGFKLALLTSYLRFVPNGTYRYIALGVIAACVAFHLSFLLVQINLCQPVRKQWDPSITYGSCIPGVPFYTAMASITIVFDITVMLLPFPVLLRSHIQKRKKFVLLGLFGLGVFITIIQIIRIQTVKQLSNYIDSAPLILWSAVENNLGIIVANVPTLAPLIKYYHERSSRGNTSNRRTGYGAYGYGMSGAPSGSGPGGIYFRSRGDTNSRYGNNTSTTQRTWRSDNRSIRAKALELGSVHDATELGSFEGIVTSKGNGSMESILESGDRRGSGGSRGGDGGDDDGGDVHPGGITKKVEVIVTRS